jgi:hypothetical protein
MTDKKLTSTVAVSATISASPKSCYDIIADYRVGHPKIIPPKSFGPINVERGGTGEGTRFTCSFKMFGREVPFTSEVTEPVPGRVIAESLEETGATTTFTVADDGSGKAHVTIATSGKRKGGLMGIMERWMMRKFFPPIYIEELRMLASAVDARVIGAPNVLIDL